MRLGHDQSGLPLPEGVDGVGEPGVLVRERDCWANCPPPQRIQAGVDDDAVQPGGDGRVAAIGAGMAVRGQQRVLQGVSCVLTVPGGAQRDGPQPVAMTAYQLRERVPVACDVRGEQGPVLGAGLLCARRILRGSGHARQGTGLRSAGR